MKKIISFIIVSILYFSSSSTSFAKDGYIEEILNLNYEVEKLTLDLAEIDTIYFKNPKYNKLRNNMIRVNDTLKKGILEKYKSWELKYYQTNWIINNYNDFIYHLNKLFYFLKLKEQNCNFSELDWAIINSHLSMRSSFRKIQNLMK